MNLDLTVVNEVYTHCSTSWDMDENISLYRHMRPSLDGSTQIKDPAKHITIQWTISSEALDAKGHAFGATWGGNPSTFHHNLFASNTARNPSISMSGAFDFRNNVIFNWHHRTIDGGDETSMINLINNYFRPGPATNDNMRTGKPTTETGIIKSIDEVGGYPELTYDPAEVPVDSDGDGMPDEWEIRPRPERSDGWRDRF